MTIKRLLLVIAIITTTLLVISLRVSDRTGNGIIKITEIQTFYELPDSMSMENYMYLKSIGVKLPYVDIQEDKVVFVPRVAEYDKLIANPQKD